jgi:hypothetical protein
VLAMMESAVSGAEVQDILKAITGGL